MSLDEAILESVSRGQSPPTLRLYAWSPGCLSLGYAQPVGDADPGRLAAAGWDLVRRPTGGKAILHIDELTYSLATPASLAVVAGGVLPSYQRLSQALVAALARLGVDVQVQADSRPQQAQQADPICFQVPSPYEITAQAKKLIGSAQVRRKDGVLQHGSLPLSGDIARICRVLRYADDAQRAAAEQSVRARATTLEACLGQSISWDHAAAGMADGFRSALEVELVAEDLSPEESARAESLLSQKYAAQGWTERV
jgi:lipoate-protein ligase A